MLPTTCPEIECPVCDFRFSPDHYFELHEGSDETCPHCGNELRCCEVEVVRYWKWDTVEHVDAARAAAKKQRERFDATLSVLDGLAALGPR